MTFCESTFCTDLYHCEWLSVSFQDSTDAVPSDPSDRDQPTGDAPSLPLTVPATDDEVLEVLSPKRTVTPRTPTPRAPRAPRASRQVWISGFTLGTSSTSQLRFDRSLQISESPRCVPRVLRYGRQNYPEPSETRVPGIG